MMEKSMYDKKLNKLFLGAGIALIVLVLRATFSTFVPEIMHLLDSNFSYDFYEHLPYILTWAVTFFPYIILLSIAMFKKNLKFASIGYIFFVVANFILSYVYLTISELVKCADISEFWSSYGLWFTNKTFSVISSSLMDIAIIILIDCIVKNYGKKDFTIEPKNENLLEKGTKIYFGLIIATSVVDIIHIIVSDIVGVSLGSYGYTDIKSYIASNLFGDVSSLFWALFVVILAIGILLRKTIFPILYYSTSVLVYFISMIINFGEGIYWLIGAKGYTTYSYYINSGFSYRSQIVLILFNLLFMLILFYIMKNGCLFDRKRNQKKS